MRRCCLIRLKNSSICHRHHDVVGRRSIYVAFAKFKALLRNATAVTANSLGNTIAETFNAFSTGIRFILL